jgi:outer membrane receptor protein involved in Fe transport
MSVFIKIERHNKKQYTFKYSMNLICGFVLITAGINQGVWAADEPVKLDKVEVTGSHIKRVDTEGPSPVAVISEDEIAQSGAASLSELLSDLTMTNGESFDEKYANSFSPGTSSINLRGLGSSSTLVLINGRRVANHSFASELTDSFVDLNSIPLAAIERIEIQKDGASAIYGSDALAGVVNIILKQNFDGASVSLRGGQSRYGDANESGISIASGISNNSGNITFVLDYSKRSEVGLIDREFSESADHSAKQDGFDFTSPTFPTANVLESADPFIPAFEAGGVNPALYGFYDFNQDISLIPESERLGVLISMNREITPDLTFFSQVLANQSRSLTFLSPSDVWGFEDGVVVQIGQAFNTFVDGTNTPIDVYPYWRMSELGRRSLEVETDSHRVIAGLEGAVSDWEWEGAFNYSRSRSIVTGKNYVDRLALIDAINSDAINPFGTSPNTASALDSIRATISRKGESEQYGVDAKAVKEITEMENGPLMLAVGLGRVHESMLDTPDAALAEGRILGQGSTSVDGERDRSALFTEVSMPVSENVEVQLALRSENYSDVGTTTNPKVAVRYQPSSTTLLRASVGTGFRAPSLTELYIGESVDRPFLIDGAIAPTPTQYPVVYSGNPDLDPETSISLFLGGVFEPTSGLEVGIDYWRFEHKDVIDNNAQLIVDNEASYPGQVIRPGGPGTSIAVVFADFVNIAEQKTDGIDLDVSYGWKVGKGKLRLKETATQLLSFKRKVSSGRSFESLAGEYRYPKLRSKTTLIWDNSSYSTSLSANYIGGYRDKYYGRLNPNTGAIDTHEVDAQLTYDIQFVYHVGSVSSLTVGIDNVTDEDPPFSNSEIEGYDFATHDPRGRFFYAKYTAEF